MNLEFVSLLFSNKGLPERRWRDQTQPLCSETNALMWCNGDAYRTNGQTGGPGRSSAEAETRRFHLGWLIWKTPRFFGSRLFLCTSWFYFFVLKATSVWSVSAVLRIIFLNVDGSIPYHGAFFFTRWVFIRVTQIYPDFGTSPYGLWPIPTCHHWWIKKSSWDP